MDKTDKNLINKNEDNNRINITCIGFNLQFDLVLSLTKEQYTNNKIIYNAINKLEDLKEKINENILSLIKITSNNFLFNVILFLNRANKIKSNIRYIIPFVSRVSIQFDFFDKIIKDVLEKEGIEILPINIMKKNFEIHLILNLIENNKIISTKKFFIDNNSQYNDNPRFNKNINLNQNKQINNITDNKTNQSNVSYKDDDIKINFLINSIYKGSFILTSTDNINGIINLFQEKKAFEKIIEYLHSMKLCIIYDTPLNDFTQKIMGITNIFFFEKSLLNQFFKIDNKSKIINSFTNQIEQNENKIIKIEIIIDNLKEISIIQYDSISQLIIHQLVEPIILYQIKHNNRDDDNEKEDNIITNNYNYLKSVYIGAFLSRLLYKKSFNTCFEAAVDCTIKIIKELKDEGKYLQDNNNNYTIIVKKKLNYSKSMKNYRNYKMEDQFILDGNNICEMNSRKEYNPIFDNYCISFFESIKNRKFLYKSGFINKNGRILIDPDRINKSRDIKSKKVINMYQKEMKNFSKIKIKNDVSIKLLEKLSKAKIAKIDKNKFNMNTFDKLNIRRFKKEYFLPSLKEEKCSSIFGQKLYNKEVKKNTINSNAQKRYFIGLNLNKIYYKANNGIKSLDFSNKKNKTTKKKDLFSYNNKFNSFEKLI